MAVLLCILIVAVIAVGGYFFYQSSSTGEFRKAIESASINDVSELYADASDSKRSKYEDIIKSTVKDIADDLNSHDFDNDAKSMGADAVTDYMKSKWGSLLPSDIFDDAAWTSTGLIRYLTDKNNEEWLNLKNLTESKIYYCIGIYSYYVEQDYDEAFESFSVVIPSDSLYQKAGETADSCVGMMVDDVMKNADSAMADGDISSALEELNEVRDWISDNSADSSAYLQKIDAAASSYAETYIKKAETAFGEHDVNAAVGNAEAALSIVPGNSDYQAKLDMYKQYLPFALYDEENILNVETVSNAYCHLDYYTNMQANNNRDMENVIIWSGTTTWDSMIVLQKANYILDSKYDTVSGMFFLPKSNKDSAYNGYLEIYGDGKLLYTSPTISASFLPQDFEINVTGINKLQIIYYAESSAEGRSNCGVSNLIAQKSFPEE